MAMTTGQLPSAFQQPAGRRYQKGKGRSEEERRGQRHRHATPTVALSRGPYSRERPATETGGRGPKSGLMHMGLFLLGQSDSRRPFLKVFPVLCGVGNVEVTVPRVCARLFNPPSLYFYFFAAAFSLSHLPPTPHPPPPRRRRRVTPSVCVGAHKTGACRNSR